MNIIFLDFDGPLIPRKMSVVEFPTWGERFDEVAVATINLALELAQAQIVVSSSWCMFPKKSIQAILNMNGIPADALHNDWKIGKTDNLRERAKLIKDWLANHPEVKNYAVIDDMRLPVQNLVHVSSDNGMSLRNQNKLFYLLGVLGQANKYRENAQLEKVRRRNTMYWSENG